MAGAIGSVERRRRRLAGASRSNSAPSGRTINRAGPSIDRVTSTLRQYADRSVFRGFSVTEGRGGRQLYSFTWLTRRPVRLLFDPERNGLCVSDMFPTVDPRSVMVLELRQLVRGRSSRKLPAHKRLDRRKARLTCEVRAGSFSLGLIVQGANHEYAVRHLLNLVNELHLLLHEKYPEYLVTEFGLSEE